jgi:mercuric reductase
MVASHVDAALERLNRRLPLAGRQQALPPEYAAAHRAVLRSLYEKGQAPDPATLPEGALARLGADDLVVVSTDGTRILGAYPMTTEPTPHRLILPGCTVQAMCAVDALSVSAMFGGAVEIESKCRVTGDPVRVKMNRETIVSASPEGVLVGVRWDKGCCGAAAHSLCVEMVFLRDEAAARHWSGGDVEAHTVLSLAEGAEFGARFFTPLV